MKKIIIYIVMLLVTFGFMYYSENQDIVLKYDNTESSSNNEVKEKYVAKINQKTKELKVSYSYSEPIIEKNNITGKKTIHNNYSYKTLSYSVKLTDAEYQKVKLIYSESGYCFVNLINVSKKEDLLISLYEIAKSEDVYAKQYSSEFESYNENIEYDKNYDGIVTYRELGNKQLNNLLF